MGIHWYRCHPTFLWKINFRLVRRLISVLIWDICGLWNCSDGQDFREIRIVFSRFLTPYIETSILASGTLFQLYDSLECGCILNNSISQKCDSNGKCTCEEKYSGLKCTECASGFIGYPECKGTKKFLNMKLWFA